MPVTIIYDTDTHHIAIIAPPMNDEGQVILPEGGNYAARQITDTEAAKLTQVGSYLVDVSGTITVVPPAPTSPDPREQAIARLLGPSSTFSLQDRQDFAVVLGVTPPTE